MNLDEAIGKHAEWKVRFRSAITKKDTMDVATIRQDNRCVLGQWLYGEGRSQYGSRPSFVDVVAKHADFHRNAGKVAEAINAKQYDAAEAMLTGGTDYGRASTAVAAAITALKRDM